MSVDAERHSQLMRGSLDMCLLALLQQQPSHAYELADRLARRGLPEVGYGTLYPLVTRLRRLELVREQVEPSPAGPPRKVFHLTDHGRATVKQWADQWWSSVSVMHAMLDEAGLLPPAKELP